MTPPELEHAAQRTGLEKCGALKSGVVFLGGYGWAKLAM
jgi:hypothetical protein